MGGPTVPRFENIKRLNRTYISNFRKSHHTGLSKPLKPREQLTMLFNDVPSFDLLTEQISPYAGFGETSIFASELPYAYLETIDQVRRRVLEVFGIDLNRGIDCIKELEQSIDQIWTENWDPHQSDMRLFVTDFGCVVAEALRRSLKGILVLRSTTDLLHASLWWELESIEVFPFHKMYKCLNSVDGESLTYFV